MTKQNISTFPYASIVVLTFNSEKTIRRCLEAISRQNYPSDRFEIIVIDNGSTDNTSNIVQEFGFEYHIKPGVNISHMRNFGIERANGEIVGFIDSDCIVVPNWLSNGTRHFHDESVGVAGCAYSSRKDASWVERAWCTRDEKRIRTHVNLPAGNMIVQKSVFEDVGAFDSDLVTGEDSDLCIRIMKKGYEIIFDPSMKNVHLGSPNSLLQILKKQIWHGKGMVRVFRKQQFADRVFLATNAFILFHVCFFLVLLSPLEEKIKIPITLCLLSGIISLLFVTSLLNAMRSGIYSYVLHLIPIFYMYFLGRSVALLKIYFRFLGKWR